MRIPLLSHLDDFGAWLGVRLSAYFNQNVNYKKVVRTLEEKSAPFMTDIKPKVLALVAGLDNWAVDALAEHEYKQYETASLGSMDVLKDTNQPLRSRLFAAQTIARALTAAAPDNCDVDWAAHIVLRKVNRQRQTPPMGCQTDDFYRDQKREPC